MSGEFDVFENCFITFPSLSAGDDQDVSTALNYKNDVPVVILLGWGGCQQRHLRKYSAIYEKRCITICYTAPMDDLYFRFSRVRSAAGKLLQLIVDRDLQEHPVFVHAFSNGGCRVYRFLSDLIHNESPSPSIRLCGIVFDSCPSAANIWIGVQVYLSLCNRLFLIKCVMAVFLIAWMIVVRIAFQCRECIPFAWIPADDFWDFMCNDPAVCPNLYLYSVKDVVIPHEEVEKLIEVRRRKGVDVVTQRWDDSTHVAHFITHRETYTTACLDFLQHCLPPA